MHCAQPEAQQLMPQQSGRWSSWQAALELTAQRWSSWQAALELTAQRWISWQAALELTAHSARELMAHSAPYPSATHLRFQPGPLLGALPTPLPGVPAARLPCGCHGIPVGSPAGAVAGWTTPAASLPSESLCCPSAMQH